MRVLSLDYGEKRIGVAISDPLNITAQPLEHILNHSNNEETIESISSIINAYNNIDTILIGLPKSLNKNNSIAADKVRQFGSIVENKLKKKVIYWDERFTTKMAKAIKPKQKYVDSLSAAIILQEYMDKNKNG